MTTLVNGERNMESLKKDLKYFEGLAYPYAVEELEEDGKKYFSMSIPDLPGCGAEGETIEEARSNLEDAKLAWIETALDSGFTIPEPVIEEDFSGKFLLRMLPKLHMRLSKNAEREGKSLNQYIGSILEGNVNLNMLFQESTKLFMSRFAAFERGFEILSLRLASLESSYNKLSDCLQLMYLRGGINYSTEFIQTDAIEGFTSSHIMRPGQAIVGDYSCPKPRTSFHLKKAPETA